MSAQEIITALPTLTAEELQQVRAKVEELTQGGPSGGPWGLLAKWVGKAEGLPPDLAENHDHYLHGAPRKKP